MQNHPNFINKIECFSYNLSNEFPVELLKGHLQNDTEATLLHYHNCIEIGYCHEGAGIFIINNKILPFSKGDVVVVFENQYHIAQSAKGTLSKWDFIFFDPVKLLPGNNIHDYKNVLTYSEGVHDFENVIVSASDPFISQLFLNAVNELEHCQDNYISAVKSLFWSLLIKIDRLIKPGHSTFNPQSKNNMIRLAKALEYISNNYASSIKIPTLAALCNMSLTNFRRIFKETVGIPPQEYIIKLRIQIASVLLNDSEYSILDISLKVGYSSLSSFNRHFKRIMRVSPSRYRISSI